MTDLELLEAAAKAAGVRYDPAASKPHPTSGAFWGLWLWFDDEPSEIAQRYWNPLRNDGDAFRLAVALRMRVNVSGYNAEVVYYTALGADSVREEHNTDPAAATRRAIVRAAAAVAQG